MTKFECCARWCEFKPSGYGYKIQNSTKGAPSTETDLLQCISYSDATRQFGWRWNRPNPKVSGNCGSHVCPTYPIIIIDKWTWNILPKKLSELTTFKTDIGYKYTQKPTGYLNLSYDIYLSSNTADLVGSREAEIMIWLNWTGGTSGTSLGTFNDGYRTYDVVYRYNSKGKLYVAFIMQGGDVFRTVQSYRKVNIKKMFDYLVNNGLVENTWYLGWLAFGNEIGSGSGKILNNKHDMTINTTLRHLVNVSTSGSEIAENPLEVVVQGEGQKSSTPEDDVLWVNDDPLHYILGLSSTDGTNVITEGANMITDMNNINTMNRMNNLNNMNNIKTLAASCSTSRVYDYIKGKKIIDSDLSDYTQETNVAKWYKIVTSYSDDATGGIVYINNKGTDYDYNIDIYYEGSTNCPDQCNNNPVRTIYCVSTWALQKVYPYSFSTVIPDSEIDSALDMLTLEKDNTLLYIVAGVGIIGALYLVSKKK